MMTVHSAKGLEFDAVFLTGSRRVSSRTSRARATRRAEEERRLAYVAITRARNRLYLSHAQTPCCTARRATTFRRVSGGDSEA